MEKINVAELLKGCPSGMELDCTMYENLYFDSLNADYYGTINCYTLIDGIKTSINFTKYGTFNNHTGAKCVIFPKGKTTWDGFHQRPFKDGDILTTNIGSIFIFSHLELDRTSDRNMCKAYVGIQDTIPISLFHTEQSDIFGPYESMCRFATAEEKEKLFDTIKENGYCWNSETKTLEKLVEPQFKDGDIVTCKDGGLLVACIYKERENTESFNHHIAFYKGCLGVLVNGEIALTDDKLRFATEEEKAKLFKSIKYKGYKWNEETKTLDKLIDPKFKVGDRIVHKKNRKTPFVITEITKQSYKGGTQFEVLIEQQDNFELVPTFDITTLKPFESKVLIRDTKSQKWSPAIWGFYDSDSQDYQYKLVGVIARYCIPYEGNEHLLGKTDDCNKYFKTWK